jgi:hypothetical protein
MSEILEQDYTFELKRQSVVIVRNDRMLQNLGVINCDMCISRKIKELSLNEQGFTIDPDKELYTQEIVEEIINDTLLRIPLEIHTNKTIIMYNEVMVQESDSESETDSCYEDDEYDENYIPLTRLYHDEEANTYQEINPIDMTLTTSIIDQMVIAPPLKLV